uniref:N-acetyltransferase domain-containing protein n=1 Tax=Chromera velia CCMP2878 TaxID=1169474 RepID=A0A0G4I9G1_9ALVE|eukprot:Cvel_12146.t1-p1 / transcript=Cvel_12146.t1 / gene=Cvel_12146 / organism=Chromera_velia_CCMP2878 / gene_product=hypothetical protein / transcript_product=hypothetical protein / location=Cvel_scaffold783:10568-13885(+) / protein_length=644 / sequence_SO=supercontig / SO=protein_coding / is_pseudo=false
MSFLSFSSLFAGLSVGGGGGGKGGCTRCVEGDEVMLMYDQIAKEKKEEFARIEAGGGKTRGGAVGAWLAEDWEDLTVNAETQTDHREYTDIDMQTEEKTTTNSATNTPTQPQAAAAGTQTDLQALGGVESGSQTEDLRAYTHTEREMQTETATEAEGGEGGNLQESLQASAPVVPFVSPPVRVSFPFRFSQCEYVQALERLKAVQRSIEGTFHADLEKGEDILRKVFGDEHWKEGSRSLQRHWAPQSMVRLLYDESVSQGGREKGREKGRGEGGRGLIPFAIAGTVVAVVLGKKLDGGRKRFGVEIPELSWFAVDPDQRRKGHAKRLFTAFLTDLETKFPGAPFVVLDSYGKEDAFGLWRSMGFAMMTREQFCIIHGDSCEREFANSKRRDTFYDQPLIPMFRPLSGFDTIMLKNSGGSDRMRAAFLNDDGEMRSLTEHQILNDPAFFDPLHLHNNLASSSSASSASSSSASASGRRRGKEKFSVCAFYWMIAQESVRSSWRAQVALLWQLQKRARVSGVVSLSGAIERGMFATGVDRVEVVLEVMKLEERWEEERNAAALAAGGGKGGGGVEVEDSGGSVNDDQDEDEDKEVDEDGEEREDEDDNDDEDEEEEEDAGNSESEGETEESDEDGGGGEESEGEKE